MAASSAVGVTDAVTVTVSVTVAGAVGVGLRPDIIISLFTQQKPANNHSWTVYVLSNIMWYRDAYSM